MTRSRNRRLISGWLVTAILFIQIAVSAYACPLNRAATQDAAPAASMAGMPCAEMMAGSDAEVLVIDLEQPGLCGLHCQGGSHAVEQTHPPLAQTPVLFAALTVRMLEPPSAAAPAWAARQRSRERAPPLALTVSNCCFRI